jgi:hypothetical protein
METKEVTFQATREIAEGIGSLLYAATLTIRKENPQDIMALQRYAVMSFYQLDVEGIGIFMEILKKIHEPFCTAIGDEMDSGHIEWDLLEEGREGETQVTWIEDEPPTGLYL